MLSTYIECTLDVIYIRAGFTLPQQLSHDAPDPSLAQTGRQCNDITTTPPLISLNHRPTQKLAYNIYKSDFVHESLNMT